MLIAIETPQTGGLELTNTTERNTDSCSLSDLVILVRGAGDLATGVVHRLHQSGFKVVMTERPEPLAVRRAVSFCEAVWDGEITVEGTTARLADSPETALAMLERRELPVLVDPELKSLSLIAPQVIVDACLAKRNTGLRKDMAPLTMGMGPGFRAPDEVHVAIETNRGHNLGRVYYQGEPAADTGVPGNILGYTIERVLRAPCDGRFEPVSALGDRVKKGDTLATVDGEPITAQLGGVIRGLIRPGVMVGKGLKVGDIDPRDKVGHLNLISDKARALGGAVLEGILHHFNRPQNN